MCGFYGSIGKFSKYNKTLAHRGPNEYGEFNGHLGDGKPVSLSQFRLTILDLNKQSLPWQNNYYYLMYNGEIYNYIELREELKKLGHVFKTDCDAEVILEAFTEWNIKCFEKFIGMWAIVLIEKNGEAVYTSRDIAGKKPLFIRRTSDTLEFASEIKAFNGLTYQDTDFVKYWEFTKSYESCFNGITQQLPSFVNTYKKDFRFPAYYKYFDINNIEVNEKIEINEAIEELTSLLKNSIELRRRSDVPIGQFVSGGLDSSLLYKMLKPNAVAHYDLNDGSLEIVKRLVEDDSKLLVTKLSSKEELQELLPRIAYHLEMPVGHLSVPIWYKLAEIMSQNKIPVVYSGEGADELFNGYTRNQMVLLENYFWYDNFKYKGYEPIREKYLGSIFERLARLYIRHKNYENLDWMINTIKLHWKTDKPLHWNIKKLEFEVCLAPLLQISDRMMSAHSTELRCPFLDKKIIQFAFSLPEECTFSASTGYGKTIIRHLCYNNNVMNKNNKFWEYNKRKTGMAIPYDWFGKNIVDRSEWNNLLKDHIKEQLK